jgi:predicted HTH domain antitoxin
MTEVLFDLSDDVARALATDGGQVAAQVRLMAALKLFEIGTLSSGRAAELAGMSRAAFLDACGRYRVAVFNYSDDAAEAELRRDVETLRSRGA